MRYGGKTEAEYTLSLQPCGAAVIVPIKQLVKRLKPAKQTKWADQQPQAGGARGCCQQQASHRVVSQELAAGMCGPRPLHCLQITTGQKKPGQRSGHGGVLPCARLSWPAYRQIRSAVISPFWRSSVLRKMPCGERPTGMVLYAPVSGFSTATDSA